MKAIYVPPTIIEQWLQEPEALCQARQLDFVLYGGAPLSPAVGDVLSQVTDVCQMYGSVETGQIQLLVPQQGEWAYMEFNPYEEVDMQPAGEGRFEVVLHRDQKFYNRRSLHHSFPDIKVWRTGDLFIPHPTKLGVWRFLTRTDDLVLLSNSHKVNPTVFESTLSGHPLVSGALVVGTGRPQPALLLEVASNSIQQSEPHEILEQVWSVIQRANMVTPAYAQIARSNVALTKPSKPFFRTPKGTIIRKTTIDAYADEIESMFSETAIGSDCPLLKDLSVGEIQSLVRASITVSRPLKGLDDNTDFFAAGMDSLQIFELVKVSRNGLRDRVASKEFLISTRTVYQNPSISELSRSVVAAISSSRTADVNIKA